MRETREVSNHMAEWNLFDVVVLIALFWSFPLFFSQSKNIRMSTLITVIITCYLLVIIIIIITKSHNSYCSVGVKESCLSNLFMLIFLCVTLTPCVLFESLSHVINQESHVYSWNLVKKYLLHFLKFWNLPRSFHLGDFKKVNSVDLS